MGTFPCLPIFPQKQETFSVPSSSTTIQARHARRVGVCAYQLHADNYCAALIKRRQQIRLLLLPNFGAPRRIKTSVVVVVLSRTIGLLYTNVKAQTENREGVGVVARGATRALHGGGRERENTRAHETIFPGSKHPDAPANLFYD